MRLECETSFYNDEKLNTDLTHAQETADEAKAVYGACSTAAEVSSKFVTCDNFSFDAGAVIRILFENASSVYTPTLNVNGMGDKPILVNNQAVSRYVNPLQWTKNSYINFVYDGANFNVTDTPGTYTARSATESETLEKVTDEVENVVIMNGTVVNISFDNAETSMGNVSVTIAGTTNRRCFYEGVVVSGSNPFFWSAGTKLSLTLEDGYWTITDSGSTRKAIEAGKTATNYLHFSDTKGLVVSQTPVTSDTEIEALTAPNSRVVSDGFDVYKDGTNRVAHFGETTTLGENGKSQQIIDSTSLNFVAPTGSSRFTVKNGVIGHGYSKEVYVPLSETQEYLNADGTLNTATLASLIADLVDRRVMSSSDYDYVIAASRSNTTFVIELHGYAISGGESTQDYRLQELVGFSITSQANGKLTITGVETIAADWTDTAESFAALFPAGATDHMIWADFTLNYPISDVQMTLGARRDGSTVGAKSVSIGSNNVASGTGSIAIGKGLTATDDYSFIVGENNIPMEDGIGNHMPTAFAIGANNSTPFAVLKNGIICMSAANSGKSPQQKFVHGTRTDVRIDFPHEYPSTPFVFLTLNEDNVPSSAVSDYGRIQIYLRAADTTGFTATVVNGGDADHTFGFSWFAISIM
jgi:hypothetical protein